MRKNFGRYLLLQLPGSLLLLFLLLFLNRFMGLSIQLCLLIALCWVAKDLLLYPLVWRSYCGGISPIEKMIGQEGVVVEDLNPVGRVRVGGELWQAEAPGKMDIRAGNAIIVKNVCGLKLEVVQKLND